MRSRFFLSLSHSNPRFPTRTNSSPYATLSHSSHVYLTDPPPFFLFFRFEIAERQIRRRAAWRLPSYSILRVGPMLERDDARWDPGEMLTWDEFGGELLRCALVPAEVLRDYAFDEGAVPVSAVSTILAQSLGRPEVVNMSFSTAPVSEAYDLGGCCGPDLSCELPDDEYWRDEFLRLAGVQHVCGGVEQECAPLQWLHGHELLRRPVRKVEGLADGLHRALHEWAQGTHDDHQGWSKVEVRELKNGASITVRSAGASLPVDIENLGQEGMLQGMNDAVLHVYVEESPCHRVRVARVDRARRGPWGDDATPSATRDTLAHVVDTIDDFLQEAPPLSPSPPPPPP